MPGLAPHWRSGPQQRLPRTVTPFQNETIQSFLHRLAVANHISALDLDTHLAEPRQPRTRLSSPRPEWLSIASGWPPSLLAQRLRWPAAGQRTTRPMPACRRCMARRGVFEPVRIHRRSHIHVCLTHQLWIGSGADRPESQVDLSPLPEVIKAQRRHSRLVRRHGAPATHAAYTDASHILTRWTERGDWPQHRQRRLDTYYGHTRWRVLLHGAEMRAANYPEVVTLTAILITSYWPNNAATSHTWPSQGAPNNRATHHPQRIYTEASRRLKIDYNPSSYDPLASWVDKHNNDHQPDTNALQRLLGPLSMTTPHPPPAIENGPPLVRRSTVVQHH